jgi:nitrate reductase gamma subunit
MWESISYFVLVPMVYIAFATLIFGIIYKLVVVFRSPAFKGSLAAYPHSGSLVLGVMKESFAVPTAYRKDKVFWFFIILYHIAFAFLFLGHLELVDEFRAIQIIPHEVFLGAGAVGIALIISVLYFLFRRFRTPFREISVPEDFYLLLILFLTFFFGSHLHLADRYGMAALDIPVGDYRTYLGSLVALEPKIPVMIHRSAHYVILVLHLLFANLFLILFPFSKMIHSVFVFFALNLKRK